ncbi:N-acetyltransferase [Mycolicibacterium sp. P1-5]|uniref:GNAT family N-acetyltransferase n=1 Tax=Mycolicibacterium sp. P1-5 TaxID=2024617 RepID=UPI0011ECC216|nr:GNAT family N-acetyltransferase [Mycolicibacterium sp. P1-5]KAA0100326.1 GNAT family N-acetyltransferase [Mycolicibacterium sp. P1-5]
MTLLDVPDTEHWSATPIDTVDHPPIADFLATTHGLSGRKFNADSRDVAEQLASALETTVLRDGLGRVRGYAAVHHPHGSEPEIAGNIVIDPAVPSDIIDDVVRAVVNRFEQAAGNFPGAYLRVITGANQPAVIDALTRRGAHREAEFIRTRKPLHNENRGALERAGAPGITVISWPEVVKRGLAEQVRQLQHSTFLEHFGNMSKSPDDWEHHIGSRAFTPDFSIAALGESGDVVGYVLGSTFTSGVARAQELSAHTDYIGVRPDLRRHGLGELLLRNVWLAALRRGLTVASLGTDINNRSKAHLLYRRLGYVAVEEQYSYRIDAAGPGQ